ncbi:Deleted in malignant brain tumors 1 protein [Lemmus lemmus]
MELQYNSSWDTACDDSWDLRDAQVVCHQLGCGGAVAATGQAQFEQGLGPMFLDDVDCIGMEARLWQCLHSGCFAQNCDHHEDAGVICSDGLGSEPGGFIILQFWEFPVPPHINQEGNLESPRPLFPVYTPASQGVILIIISFNLIVYLCEFLYKEASNLISLNREPGPHPADRPHLNTDTVP